MLMIQTFLSRVGKMGCKIIASMLLYSYGECKV